MLYVRHFDTSNNCFGVIYFILMFRTRCNTMKSNIMICYLFIKYDTIYSVIGKDRVSYKEGFNVQTPIIASWRLCHGLGDVPSYQSVSAHQLHISSLQTSVSNWLMGNSCVLWIVT